MATINGSTNNSRYSLTCEYTYTQNASANTSTITAIVYLSGNYYIECAMQEGDVAIKFSNMSIVTDLERQPIYVKTTVDDRAENRVEYRSSIAISYYED